MSRSFSHVYLDKSYPRNASKGFDARSIPLKINRVGKLTISVKAEVKMRNPLFGQPGPGNPKPFIITTIPIAYQLIDPLGVPFSNTTISMNDLNRYRDVRGFIRSWTLKIKAYNPEALFEITGSQKVILRVHEEIPLSSAAPLIEKEAVINPHKDFEFDLYRLGTLSVKVSKIGVFFPNLSTAKISLFRPDGIRKAFGDNGRLDVSISPKDLRLSRGPNQQVKKWKIRVEDTQTDPQRVLAQVYDQLELPRQLVLDRLHYLLGAHGENFKFKINWSDAENTNLFTLLIKEKALAENLDFYNAFDPKDTDKKYNSIETDINYILKKNIIGNEDLHLKFRDFTIDSLTIDIGSSVQRRTPKIGASFEWDSLIGDWLDIVPDLDIDHSVVTAIPANLPKISFSIKMSNSFDIVSDKLIAKILLLTPNPQITGLKVSRIDFEIAFDVNSAGKIVCLCWLKLATNAPARIDYILNGILHNYLVEPILNDLLSDTIEGVFDHLMGGAFRFTNTSWKNPDMRFEYISDQFPEPKPKIGYMPSKGFSSMGPLLIPMELRNTWKSPLLTDDPNKIKHIVVLMMENRSFDHVLGYLSLAKDNTNAINPNINGLTQKVIEQFSTPENRIQHLKNAKFPANDAGLKTKFPLSVGHHYADVLEQLKNLTMTGFVANFKKQHPNSFGDPNGIQPQDVLGYYTEEELAMYKFLADEFTICDNYFCSHPGPTLPNRMFSLTGDFHYDRNGEPKLDNSVDTTHFLTRQQNIFDVLSQYNVPWRVYESFPSVTMLRLFSRYAGNDKEIRNIETLAEDIVKPNFPSVVFIDPAMHDMPANDDHPPADMLHGQHLIKKVYKTLRSNPEVWNHCLFVITYDEHGGFFDHVPPITAEIMRDPRKINDLQSVSTGESSTGSAYMPDEKIPFGVRVPTFLVSPYVERGGVYKQTLDHTSILKTILIKFCNGEHPFMSDRVNYASDLGGALKSELRQVNAALPDIPNLPDMRRSIAARDEFFKNFTKLTKQSLESKDSDFHELMAFLGRMVKPE